MKQAAARTSAPSTRDVSVITHADLQRLFPPTSAKHKNAIILVEFVKMRARGKRFARLYDFNLWEGLGWSERTLRRAKKACIDAGLIVTPKFHSHGGRASSEWVLDRRWVKGLRGHEEQEVVPTLAPPIEDEKLSFDPARTSPGSKERPRAGPGPPPADGDHPESETDADREPAQTEPPLQRPDETPLPALIAKLRGSIPANPGIEGGIAAGAALGAAALAELDSGVSPFAVDVAVQRVLSLVAGDDLTRRDELQRGITRSRLAKRLHGDHDEATDCRGGQLALEGEG